MVLTWCVTNVKAVPYIITKIPEGTVAMFQKVTEIKQYDQVWNIATFIDLQPYRMELKGLQTLIDQSEKVCIRMREENTDNCGLVAEVNRLQMEEIIELNRLFSSHGGRQRRGLIDGVGTLAKFMFGVMDSNDAQFYNEQIDQLKEDQLVTRQIDEQQTTVIKSVVEYFNSTVEKLQENEEELRRTVEKLIIVVNKWQEFTALERSLAIRHEMNEMFQFVASKLTVFRAKQTLLVQAVTMVHHQPNVPSLVHPTMLLEQLQKIQQKSGKDVELPIDPQSDNLRLYYQLIEPEIGIVADKVIINFKIPLVEREVFELMHVIAVPVNVEGNRFKTLVPSRPYLAVNKRKDKFLEVGSSALSTCKTVSELLTICRHGVTYSLPTHSSCEMDLLTQPGKMGQTCSSNIMNVAGGMWFELAAEDSWMFVLPEEAVGKVTGPEEGVLRITLKGTGQVELKPGVTLECDGVILRAPIVSQERRVETILIHDTNQSWINQSEMEKERVYIQFPKVVTLAEGDKLGKIGEQLTALQVLHEVPRISSTQRSQWTAWGISAIVMCMAFAVYGIQKCWRRRVSRFKLKHQVAELNQEEELTTVWHQETGASVVTL